METQTGNQGASTGFLLNPEGLFRLRDYSNDDPAELKALRGLLENILTRHKTLIPGSMNRLVTQWHADVNRTIEQASSSEEEDNHRTRKAAS
jgi:hypothetical protein